MGTTFVTLSPGPTEHGFWMHDTWLELWLRLLALHVPDPAGDEGQVASRIRSKWLLASRGYFVGCVPHGMEEACASDEGKRIVHLAVESLLGALKRSAAPVDAETLNLMGFEGPWTEAIERAKLEDIAHAFLDLLDGTLVPGADVMPGTKPYARAGSAPTS